MKNQRGSPDGIHDDAKASGIELEASVAAHSEDGSLRLGLKRFTQQRILDAALECFRQSSFRATTVEQIVELAGTTVPTFYRHFSSKDDLLPPLQAYLQVEVEQVLQGLDRIDVSDVSAIAEWFDSYMAMWRRVHRLCDSFWEASALDGRFAASVYPDTLSTVSKMANILSRVDSEKKHHLETRLAMMILFMDRAAFLMAAETNSSKAKTLRGEFSHILYGVINNI